MPSASRMRHSKRHAEPPSIARHSATRTQTQTGAEPLPERKIAMSDSPKKTSKELIAEGVAVLTAQLEAGNSAALTAHLATIAKFHHYSFGNIMAIARQMPDATRVAGFHTWKSLGRNVK